MKWLVQLAGCDEGQYVEILSDDEGRIKARVDDTVIEFSLSEFASGRLMVNQNDQVQVLDYRRADSGIELIDSLGSTSAKIVDERDTWLGEGSDVQASGTITVAMPGRVVKVNVEAGDTVAQGDCVCVIEAMKMENDVRAPRDGVVARVNIESGNAVEAGQVLIELESE
ncbi:MAG TPA: biotin/lipoyl-binding protein [Myxococcales bacterium]|nr:biotin/lipoyl-binding protein [Myxococcales bacterium]HIN85235.1 biotin/lipoyl-binding protein [Myxococcales bacterium]